MKRVHLIPIIVMAICAAAIITHAGTTSRQAAVPSASAPAASPRNFKEPTTGMEFLPVPGGCFRMGDGSGDIDEKPVHQVCLDAFYVGKNEVTQGQWLQIMGSRPSFFSFCGDSCPVESVSWEDTQVFIRKFNTLNDGTYRLMTEAEWEYACRSGGKTERFCGGDDVDAAAWYDKNSGSKPHPVGEKRANGLGIYDMSGNVWEWVNDRYNKDYYGSSPPRNPEGPPSGSKRVIRGGSWYNDPKNVRASIRSSDEPYHRSINLGFRLAYSVR
jgi:formylglycine-generating enzyme required for sulfatase activity